MLYLMYRKEVDIMKIYVFECFGDMFCHIAAKSMDNAIAKFKEAYPTRTFSCVYEL